MPWSEYVRARLNWAAARSGFIRSEEHTSELQSQSNLVCRLLLEKKKKHTHDRADELILDVRNAHRMLHPANQPGHAPRLRLGAYDHAAASRSMSRTCFDVYASAV